MEGQPLASGAGYGVNQTSFLFGALIFGFLWFITVRGDLAKWLGVFGLAGFPQQASTQQQPGLGLTGLNPVAGMGAGSLGSITGGQQQGSSSGSSGSGGGLPGGISSVVSGIFSFGQSFGGSSGGGDSGSGDGSGGGIEQLAGEGALLAEFA